MRPWPGPGGSTGWRRERGCPQLGKAFQTPYLGPRRSAAARVQEHDAGERDGGSITAPDDVDEVVRPVVRTSHLDDIVEVEQVAHVGSKPERGRSGQERRSPGDPHTGEVLGEQPVPLRVEGGSQGGLPEPPGRDEHERTGVDLHRRGVQRHVVGREQEDGWHAPDALLAQHRVDVRRHDQS